MKRSAEVSADGRKEIPASEVKMVSMQAAAVVDAQVTGDRIRLYALGALTVVLVGLCILLAVPFLPAITWSVALAIIAWPMHRWISTRITDPRLAAIVSSLLVAIMIVAPGLFVSYHLAREATIIAEQMRDNAVTEDLREKLSDMPGFGSIMAWMERADVQIEAEARRIIALYTADAAGLAQGSLTAIIQFLAAMFILYHLLREHGFFLRGLRSLMPLSQSECDQVLGRARASVYANVYATFLTSFIDASTGGLVFWYLGLPAPVLWAVVMFVFGLLPVVGNGLVWVPALTYLLLSDQFESAGILFAWGLTTFIFVDNILFFRLTGKRMRMNEAPTLIAFLGGLAVFGISGMILGPAILAVTVAILEVWKRRLADGPELQS